MFVTSAPVGGVRMRALRRTAGLISFAAMASVTSALLGVVLSSVGSLLVGEGAWYQFLRWAVAGTALVYAFAELYGKRLWYPQRHWLVPKEWGYQGRVLYGAAFGAILGLGVLTYIPFVGLWFVLAYTLLGRDPVLAGLTFGAFGVGRALTVVIPALVSWSTPRRVRLSAAYLHSVASWLQSRSLRWVRAAVLLAFAGLLQPT